MTRASVWKCLSPPPLALQDTPVEVHEGVVKEEEEEEDSDRRETINVSHVEIRESLKRFGSLIA